MNDSEYRQWLEAKYGQPYAELVRRGIVGEDNRRDTDLTMRDGVSSLQF